MAYAIIPSAQAEQKRAKVKDAGDRDGRPYKMRDGPPGRAYTPVTPAISPSAQAEQKAPKAQYTTPKTFYTSPLV